MNLKELFKAKDRRRKELAALSFEEKIAILIQLQEWASSITKEVRGVCKKPWKI